MSWRRLQNALKTSWRCLDFLARRLGKMSWRCLKEILKTSSKCLEDALKMSWSHFCKTSWRRPENVLKRSWQDVLKKCWKCLEDVLKTSSEDLWLRQIYSSWSRRLEGVLKTSSEGNDERRFQDVFIKSNVCWATTFIRFTNT